jgi:RNA polymerase sigma factor (sigma-70 family)
MHDDWSDGDLLDRYARVGDEDAFAELVRRHRQLVFRVCRRITGSDADAEDALQQVFVILAEKAQPLAFRESVAGWLYRTAWQLSCRHLRATTIRRRYEDSVGEDIEALAVIAAPEAGDEEQSLELHRAIGRLPDAYREAMVLHHLEGYSVAEAASRMRIPVGTVAARLSRGREMLRQQLRSRDRVLSLAALEALLLAEAHRIRAVARRPSPKGGRPPALPSVRMRPIGPVAATTGMAVVGASSLSWVRHVTIVGLASAFTVAAPIIAPALVQPLRSHASSDSVMASKDNSAGFNPFAKPSAETDTQPSTQSNSSPRLSAAAGAPGVPEPNTLAVLVATGCILGLRRRR